MRKQKTTQKTAGSLHRLRDEALRALSVRAAKLPKHFTPHGLRHTFASLPLQAGESAQYVKEQLGHASITLTVDTYGRWFAVKPVRGSVNILGDVVGSKSGSRRSGRITKPLMNIGEPCGTRTHDPLIKSRLPKETPKHLNEPPAKDSETSAP
jgi:integrase-like protein